MKDTLVRKNVPIDSLVPQEVNPNKMSKKKFNLLVDNIEQMGFTDPLLVREHPTEAGKYRIVGGTHRWEAAKLIGYEELPVTVITDPEFDEDRERFQIVRHNVIKGSMVAEDFVRLYESLSQKYSDELASELFGFEEEAEFKKLIKATAKALPKELQDSFKEAAKEIKTVDGLAKLLNELFTKHGDTLPYGYMIFDFGGKDSIWLRMKKSDMGEFKKIAARCKAESVAIDGIMSVALKLLSEGEVADRVFSDPSIEKVVIPTEAAIPSLDYLDHM